MTKTDVLIIGAGLLGCFTARNLMRYEIDVVVIEKDADVCRGISKANTGIIYSGYNNSPVSVKQKLCIRANEDFERLCSELGVIYKRPGSLMISYGPRGDAVIARKYRDGIKGGVMGIELLSGSEAESMEPALAKGITSALYSSETGTVDPWDLCIAAYENAEENGACFMFGQKVLSVRRENGGFTVVTDNGCFSAAAVVNAAGLSSDIIREMTEDPRVRIFPSAADYIVLDRQEGNTVKHVILHEGEDGKGLTLVPTVDGNLLIGPTNRDAEADAVLASDMRTDRTGLDQLEELCGKVASGIDIGLQIRTFGSLRPNPYYVKTEDGRTVREDKSIKDIQIFEEAGLFSLIGIKTPGLTVSNELGMIVADKAAAYAGRTMPNAEFDPCRKAIRRARDMSLEERAAAIKMDPDYGEVICPCMDVTLSEVKQAVNRGAHDFESVKRRTGAGFGKCQGSRCRRRIMDIIENGE